MVRRNVVGAHYGLVDWLAQRVTAVLMAAYAMVVAVALLQGAAADFVTWRSFMASGLMRFFSFVLVLALAWHAWVGVRDIWMDYVKPVSLRLALHVLTLFALIGSVGWALGILWRL
ncbi:MAG: succinate dehydrogenase, hydrophobic membrane anchor protein [Rhodocyclaceae bacterium]|nr:succinate dehydrogenase, hydrophobic membrane anchor protein [Rhodocyclaceae bacterium]